MQERIPQIFYVDKLTGRDTNNGRAPVRALKTLQKAIDECLGGRGDRIIVNQRGEGYDEEVVIPRSKSRIALEGFGGRGSVWIEPSDENGVALTNEADDVTLINIGCDGEGAGGGLVNRGRRFRAYASKFEGGANAITLSLGTDAQITALTHGKGDDLLFHDCEIAWADNGVLLLPSDYGAVTQIRFRNSYFHGLPDSSFEEDAATAAVCFRDLNIIDCEFGDGDGDGTLPTAWILLNDDNGNTGIVSGCKLPTALDSGKNLVSTKLLWVSNFHLAGISNGQPTAP